MRRRLPLAESCLSSLIPEAGIADWTVLALWLVEQRHLWRSGAEDGELWGPYIQVSSWTRGRGSVAWALARP